MDEDLIGILGLGGVFGVAILIAKLSTEKGREDVGGCLGIIFVLAILTVIGVVAFAIIKWAFNYVF